VVLVALDAATGKEAWTATVADNKQGHLHVGGAARRRRARDGRRVGGEVGVPSFVAAATPGRQAGLEDVHGAGARRAGQRGGQKGDHWKTGGASVWVTGTYDPEMNSRSGGTGNGGPWMGDQRPGDNLYISSTVAFDVATGAIKGHFQYERRIVGLGRSVAADSSSTTGATAGRSSD
jgi:alcohol dehydrogenase (cytochrome c)